MVKLYRNERGQIKVAEGSVQLVNEDGSAIRCHPTKFSMVYPTMVPINI